MLFETTTATCPDSPDLPDASYARAVTMCVPFGTDVLLQLMAYGATVSAPTIAPSIMNSTRVTPTSSVAVAASVADPVTVA